MAKRMTDSGKWDKRWFRTLPSHIKLMWLYLCDSCDAAGIWSEDLDLASFKIGETITRDEYNRYFEDRLVRLEDDKVFIPGFIEFQYGELREDSKPHLAVIRTLQKHCINPQNLTLSKGYRKGIQTLKDKDKDKDKDKEKDKDSSESESLDFESLWQSYPRKIGKTEARARFARLIKTGDDLQALGRAVANYRSYVEARATEERFIKHMASFLGTEEKQAWRDWIDFQDSGSGSGPVDLSDIFGEPGGAA